MSKSSRKNVKFPSLDSDDDFERISAILTPDQPLEGEPPEVTPVMLERYYVFLKSLLVPGVKMTGRETTGYFAWEERFEFGSGSSKEYQALTEQFASCFDTFELLSLAAGDEKLGLMATVKRITDQKIFTIPLADLEVCPTREYQLVDDYSTWFVNYGPDS